MGWAARARAGRHGGPAQRGTSADGNTVLTDPTLKKIADAKGKSAAQVALRWLVQQGIVAIPKASSEGHLRANMDIFDWALDAEEMERLG